MESEIYDYARNINTGALTGMFPFYNAEISHPGGTFMGINQSTATAIFLDWYNKSLLNNANGFVFGTSGSGKTYFVSLLTLRSAIIDGVRTVVIDAEGEYGKVTNAVGGIVIKFEPTEKFKLNCFDIEAEPVIDDLGNNTGEVIVDIKSKAADILNLIAVMSQGTMTPDIQSGVSEVIKSLYTNIGITENPDSLYTQSERGVFNKETGEYSFGKIEDITDKGYYTNSYHVDVREKIDIFSKFKFESVFQNISSGGAISYGEVPNMEKNLEALETVVKFIYDNIQYAEFNTKSDYCQQCGFSGEIIVNENLEWECPNCHNTDRKTLNVNRNY